MITYIDNGTRKACGQILGADGRGKRAVLFDTATPEEAEKAAIEYIKKLEQYEYKGRITNITLVVAYEEFCGDPIQTKKA